MREDPVARRNRGGGPGLWVLIGMAVIAAGLIVAVMLRPGPPDATEPEPEAAAVSMKERVAADERAHRRLDAAREEAREARDQAKQP